MGKVRKVVAAGKFRCVCLGADTRLDQQKAEFPGESGDLLRLFWRGKARRAGKAKAEFAPNFDKRRLDEMVQDDGHCKGKRHKEQRAKKQILDIKDNKNEIEDGKVNQIHAVGVESDLPGNHIERPVGGVVKGIDRQSEKQAEYPADPVVGAVVKVSKTVAGDQQ
jgi:hypothetical protein